MINKYSMVAIAVVVITAVIILYLNSVRLEEELLNPQVTGRISNIEIKERGMPYFHINDSLHYFGRYGFTIDRVLDAGDSVAKIRGERVIKMYKRLSADSVIGYDHPTLIKF